MSTRIAFIGLGIMGAPMAANLLKAGFDGTSYNRSPGQADRLISEAGASPRRTRSGPRSMGQRS